MVKRQWFGLASVSITVPEQLDTCDTLVTVRNVVAARLCFHRCLSFCSQGRGMYPNMHPGYTPWADTSPEQTKPPPGRHPLGRHPPAQCMLGYTPPADTLLPSACWDTPPRADSTPWADTPCPVHAGIHTPPWKDTPPHPSQTATAVDAPHPTGMRSCFLTVTVVV